MIDLLYLNNFSDFVISQNIFEFNKKQLRYFIGSIEDFKKLSIEDAQDR
jgi:hypothetical protein